MEDAGTGLAHRALCAPSPGDLLHLDIKKLGRIVNAGPSHHPLDKTRGTGCEVLYVAGDDHSRLAFTSMYPDEKAASSSNSSKATAFFCRFGDPIRRVLTDNRPRH
ncbi:MAG: hypothetical protein QOJ51_4283 [Acidobacteriaceae bacterium]|nr:hypothetical protein [Acidobacteriaceae bacterium]